MPTTPQTSLEHRQSNAESSKPEPTPKPSPVKTQRKNTTGMPPNKLASKPSQPKTVPRRSSKPIINWFQRKLAGTGRAKRNEATKLADSGGRAMPVAMSSRLTPRIASSPSPGGRQQGRNDASRRKTISLNDDDTRDFDDGDNTSLGQSSFARESTWSPASGLEADDDASLRPIPPSVPPSPSPSRSSSSYLSDPRTFRSIAASTKPTTLLSIDLNGNGMAHIAQAPTTPPLYINRFPPHIRNSSSTAPQYLGSGTSITFSALPQSSSRPSSLSTAGGPNPQNTAPHGAVIQAPLHTTHHPRNNPRPSSPPLDNASVLTLASSAYAIPGLRATGAPSARGVGDSLSHFGGSVTYDAESTSQFLLGEDGLDERDVDASVRALRPRSSRRGSWESEASGWSAQVQAGTGTPSLIRERSLWTTNSVRTGGRSENAETYERSDEVIDAGEIPSASPTDHAHPDPHSPQGSVGESPVDSSHSNIIEIKAPSSLYVDEEVGRTQTTEGRDRADTVVQLTKPASICVTPEQALAKPTTNRVTKPHREKLDNEVSVHSNTGSRL